MIQYFIMSFIFGFAGNKLFGKDKSMNKSIEVAVFSIVIFVLLDVLSIFV